MEEIGIDHHCHYETKICKNYDVQHKSSIMAQVWVKEIGWKVVDQVQWGSCAIQVDFIVFKQNIRLCIIGLILYYLIHQFFHWDRRGRGSHQKWKKPNNHQVLEHLDTMDQLWFKSKQLVSIILGQMGGTAKNRK